MKRIRILLADDHTVVRNGLRFLFKTNKEFSVVGEAPNGAEAVQMAARLGPDVVILDISMPKMNGIEATRQIREKSPNTKILILTIHVDEQYVQEMIQAGANGYVLKDADRGELFSAVRAVASSEPFFSPHISRLILDRFVRKGKAPATGRLSKEAEKLTRRENEVLRLIAEGLTSKEIAEKLFLSPTTVNTHRANLMQKLGIHDMARLVRFAMEHGLVQGPPGALLDQNATPESRGLLTSPTGR